MEEKKRPVIAMASVGKCLSLVQSVHLIATLLFIKPPSPVGAQRKTPAQGRRGEEDGTGTPAGDAPDFHPDPASRSALPKGRAFSCPKDGAQAPPAEGKPTGEQQGTCLGLGEPYVGKEATAACRDSRDADAEGGCPCREPWLPLW